MTRRHRRYSTEFKIQVVQEYLDGEGSIRAVAVRHGVGHSLVRIWAEKYQRGELTEEVQLKEQVDEYEARIAALERKVGQLTMELDVAKKTASQLRSLSGEQPSIISGPAVFRPREDAGS
jgi:transposase